MAYLEKFKVTQPRGKYVDSLTNWYGSVAKVSVNGQLAGYIGYRPWECEVTDWIKPGTNKIEVTVVGTLKNTLGPHHSGLIVGKAWPNMFEKGLESGPPSGDKYHTIGYGLYEPFVLIQLVN